MSIQFKEFVVLTAEWHSTLRVVESSSCWYCVAGVNHNRPAQGPGGEGSGVLRSLLDLRPHALDLRELLDRRAAERLAVTRELEAAVGHRGVDHLVRVDPHGPDAQRAGGAVGAPEIARPDPGGKPVLGVVGDPVGLLLR